MYKMYYTPTNTPLDGIVMASGIVFAAYNFLMVVVNVTEGVWLKVGLVPRAGATRPDPKSLVPTGMLVRRVVAT